MTTIKSIRLTFTEGSSDKEYNAQIVQSGSGYVVNFQYGRRNGTLQSGTKTESPVSLEAAEKVYTKIVKEKTSKGYSPEGESVSTYIPVKKEELDFIPQLLNPITDSELSQMVSDSAYVFQPKKDGERRLAYKSNGESFGGNRKGQKVSLPAQIIESLESETDIVLDGEIIGTTLHVFDLLQHNGKDYKKKPYNERLSQLKTLKFGQHVVVVETAVTTSEKKVMLQSLKDAGAEGVVIKTATAQYTSSRPASGGTALKYKFYKTATVKVSSITKGKRSVQVSVLENGTFVDVGAVTIPANHEIPKVGELVEVRYLYAYKGGCLYQPTYLGVRNDLDDSDAKVEQLEYKQEEAQPA